MKLISCAAFLKMLLLTDLCAKVAAAPEMIIYIMGDDIGPGDLGFTVPGYSSARYITRTPNLDQLKANSALYPNVLGATVCGPSRASFLTGRPQTYSVWRGNADTVKNYQVPYTLPRALQEIGWVPIISGKFGFGDCATNHSVKDFGFAKSLYYATHVDAHYPFPLSLFEGCNKVTYANNINASRNRCLSNKCIAANDVFLSFTLAQIEQCVLTKQKCAIFHMPTYTHVGIYNINNVMTYPVDSYERYPNAWGIDRRGYGSMVTKFDLQIGAILDKVKSLDRQNTTLTFVFGDNGAECFYMNGRPKCGIKPFGSSGGRRGVKRSMYCGGIETPVIVNWPGTISANYSSKFPWALHDLALTTLDILQAPAAIVGKFTVPAQILDGLPISVAKMLLHGDNYVPDRKLLFTENCEGGESSCTYSVLNTSDWRNTLPRLVCNSPKCVPELYDIAADHAESNNLAQLPVAQPTIQQLIASRSANRIRLLN